MKIYMDLSSDSGAFPEIIFARSQDLDFLRVVLNKLERI
jgi:hypothetical protein